jgi:protocatechuate 3,4-dioxygenase alpha subunit
MPSTASQTAGPFWHLLQDTGWADLTRFGAEGERIVLTGRIVDGGGAPVTDACVEIWQADPPASDRFQGFGRAGTDADGRFRFVTLRPGPVRGRGNAQQAPHIAVQIFARGLLRGLATRAYFAGEALNATDPLLASIEDPERRATLIAQADGAGAWRLDIRLQGEAETVFLDI